jgi:PAS domain S-box-containing protein
MDMKLNAGSEKAPDVLMDQVKAINFTAKQVEDEHNHLFQSEQVAGTQSGQLNAIFEALADCIFVYDLKGNLLRLNTAASALLQLDQRPDDFTGSFEECFSLLDPRDAQGNPLARVTNLEETFKNIHAMDVVLHLPDGRRRQFSVNGAPMRNEEGNVIGSVLILHDVSEQRALEKQTQDVLNSVLSMAEALVDVNDAGANKESDELKDAISPTAINKIGHRLISLTTSVLGDVVGGIIAVDPQTEIMETVAAVGLTPEFQELIFHLGDAVYLSDFFSPAQVAQLKSGNTLAIDLDEEPLGGGRQPSFGLHKVIVFPMRISNTLVGLLGFEQASREREFTKSELALMKALARLAALALERERLLQERTKSEAKEIALRQANQHMDDFLSIASHELKNPLASVKGNVQLASRRLQNALRRLKAMMPEQNEVLTLFDGPVEVLNVADIQIERMNRLVGDLLDISRIQVGKMEMQLMPCDLLAIVHDVVEGQRVSAPQRLFRLNVPSGKEVPILADTGRIGQVIANYVSNAIRYSPEEKPVEISLSIEDGYARVAVRDEGPGLPADQQKLIWERFHQANEVKKRFGASSGLGLGLYISKTIVERHSGECGVESTPGKGSIFWFTLPVRDDRETAS